jgi:predicted kinase
MSGKLIMCKGLPGSGKSTWASKEHARLVTTHNLCAIVTKDDIRNELNQKDWNYEVEKEVLRIRDKRISEILSKGGLVISADTNLAPKHEATLRSLAKKYKADFEVKEFLDVPIEVCIARDLKRRLEPDSHYVGEKVILEMAEKFLRYPVLVHTYVPDPTKPKALICDLDGTLAIHKGRSPYDVGKCLTDAVNEPVALILKKFSEDHKILYVSGREDTFMDLTMEWLRKFKCPGYEKEGLASPLMMRQAKDTRNDAIVKLEIFDARIRDFYNVSFVLDDRDRVVKMWRDLGLSCLQVNYGNF